MERRGRNGGRRALRPEGSGQRHLPQAAHSSLWKSAKQVTSTTQLLESTTSVLSSRRKATSTSSSTSRKGFNAQKSHSRFKSLRFWYGEDDRAGLTQPISPRSPEFRVGISLCCAVPGWDHRGSQGEAQFSAAASSQNTGRTRPSHHGSSLLS